MKNARLKIFVLGALILIIVAFALSGCSEPCKAPSYEFSMGEDVHIKNKTFHDDAVITRQIQNEDCSCAYEIAYFSTLGVRRHRVVTAGEIESSSGSNAIDEIKELIDKD